ncbi:uncharacterized protein LOC131690530 [Topomyia yanbarensis]|uniref:uncharacterized protein LOC131690530 n=1 Tax=Topomyia yanbarensis TaxID=2498891 RepID=UPI00273C2C33|nr:uncharacterized protein LOC131690530 [Topomyia yanbarensis]
MLTKIILLAVAVIFKGCLANSDEVPGIPQSMAAMFQPAPMADFACANNNFGIGCVGCNKVLTCLGTKPSVTTECNTVSPYTPNCVDGQCSAKTNIAGGCKAKAIDCTGEGIYPDPRNCEIYHYCSAANSQSDIYTCPSGYVFNALTGGCKLKASAEDCVAVSCPASTGYGTFSASKSYYAFCLYSGSPAILTDIIMMKCATGATFDGNKCVFQCSTEGNFANSDDPTTYYQCYQDNGTWVVQLQKCPGSKKFDATKQICVSA